MNSKKKIIEVLRKADKASVERLMAEEAKKNEIFAKAQRRANIEQTEYADSVSGVEKYERKINMTRISSVAAAIAVVIGLIGGGHFFYRNKMKTPDVELHQTTTNVAGTSTSSKTVTTVTGKNGSIVTTVKGSAVTTTLADAVSTTVSTTLTEAVNNKPEVTTESQSSNTKTEEKVLSYIGQYTQIGETEEKIYKEYAKIIDECSTMIKNKDASGLKYESDLARELLYASYESPAHIGYAFNDVNEDGIMELLLGVNYDYGAESGDFDSVIYNIFSVDANNEVYAAAMGGLRSRYYICSNPTADRARNGMAHAGFISNEGSGGATHSSKAYYRLGYSGLNFVESVSVDGLDENNEPIIYYTNAEQSGRDTKISQDEANKITDGYSHMFIQFNSFE
ncbi:MULTISPECIES: hypothetical protein [Ruminococcus]|uniref:Uncharacterized protein n=1 Tax=Ruminococcus flavefaciens TaxID=1265 RepID=A0A1M7M4I8_RUMFL|nr:MULTISPECIES: hypothetical protein [Ruminococcus]MCR4796332.1 hypothetical protein [Ruminococcus sp.]SHM85606.1 hypothetical protein SAMN04487860_11858 [Ruminococcus flavefaciens]